MDNIEFNEPGSNLPQKSLTTDKKKSIRDWVVSIGLARNTEEAERILLVLVVACVIATIFVWVYLAPKEVKETPEPVTTTQHQAYV